MDALDRMEDTGTVVQVRRAPLRERIPDGGLEDRLMNGSGDAEQDAKHRGLSDLATLEISKEEYYARVQQEVGRRLTNELPPPMPGANRASRRAYRAQQRKK